MGSHGHRVDLDAAHSHATRFNELERLGTVGTVFHPCCLLETTTIAFHIRMLPSAPAGALWSGLDITRLVPGPGESGPTPDKSLRAHSALRILTILRIRESGFSALSPEIRRRTHCFSQRPASLPQKLESWAPPAAPSPQAGAAHGLTFVILPLVIE